MITVQTFSRGSRNAVKMIIKLTKYVVPSVFVLKILEHSGWLAKIADVLAPLMSHMGLPGEGALVILMGQVSVYSALAAMAMLGLTVKQVTILSTFVAICHAFVLETVVISKSGGNGPLIMCTRFIGAVLACLVLNQVIPGV